jgi:hypothetical protein
MIERVTIRELECCNSNESWKQAIPSVWLAALTVAWFSCVLDTLATPLDDWHWRNPLPQGNQLYSIAFGAGRFVAVGDLGAVITSTDGLNWEANSRGGYASAITYGNGEFVSFASGFGWIEKSTNGIDWVRVATIPCNFSGAGIAFGNGTFVAANVAAVGISTNGALWKMYSGVPSRVGGITFGGDLFAIASDSGLICTSTNGQQWTSISAPGFWKAIGYGNGRFIAVGQRTNQTAMLISNDGRTWIPQIRASTNSLSAICYGNGLYVAAGNGIVLTSSDCQSWAAQPANITNTIWSLAFGNGRFVALGDAGALFSSEDGTNWISCLTGLRNELKGIVYGGGKFVAVGAAGMVLDSSDGQGWQSQASGTLADLACIAAGDGIYAVGASTGDTLSSTDGVSWLRHTTVSTNALNSMCFGRGLFVAVGKRGTILSSTNGTSWTECNTGITNDLLFAAYAAGLFLAGGVQGATLSSSDGSNWTNSPGLITTNSIGCLVYGKGLFVACDNSWGIYSSADGLSWTNWVPPSTGNSMNSIAYGAGVFVKISGAGYPMVCASTTNWVSKSAVAAAPYFYGVPQQSSISSIAYGKGRFIAVGGCGTIIQSDPVLTLDLVAMSPEGLLLLSGGEPGPSHVLQDAKDLGSWEDLAFYVQTNTVTSVFAPLATNSNARFYRLKPE